jgi:hypothetical protein
MSYETGYFGVPGKLSYGKVHIVDDRKPICKSGVKRGSEFQMCGNGVHRKLVNCERCLKAMPPV